MLKTFKGCSCCSVCDNYDNIHHPEENQADQNDMAYSKIQLFEKKCAEHCLRDLSKGNVSQQTLEKQERKFHIYKFLFIYLNYHLHLLLLLD